MTTGLVFEDAKQGYRNLWSRCEVVKGRVPQADALAKVIIRNADTYKQIEAATGVPWFMVGLIHMRESDFNLHAHLHNGDPLSDYTHHVPAGRPQVGHGPPFTFAESASDALKERGLNRITDWSLERILYELEAYNGWGYEEYHGENSPYVWSWTTNQQPGKYTEDGHWSPTEIDVQPGCAAVLRRLTVQSAEIAQQLSLDQQTTAPPPSPTLGPLPNQPTRPYRYEGTILLDGVSYPYATGGLNRGSAPYGTWLITPDIVGDIGRRLGAIGVADGSISDPKYPGAPRIGIEIHPGASNTQAGLLSEGCIVLLPKDFPKFKQVLLGDIKNKGPHLLTINPDFHIVISPVTPQPKPKESPLTTAPTLSIPTLNLASIEQTLEQFGFVVNFLTPVFPAAPLVLVATETILKAGAAIQASPTSDAATLAGVLAPHVLSFGQALQAMAPAAKTQNATA